MDLIKIAEEAFATVKQHPSFKAGDTITVAYRIVEGSKERVQLYRGVVIKISGHGEKKRFTVRKMSGTVGVERIFPLESPAIDSITVNKVGKVRRAKLYYLRPSFKAGDTITVAYRIVEGSKERVQLYRGVVIKIAGHGDKKRFTVRKMSGTVGVERIFPIESPAIDSITVNKVGKVRRAKLYYLRALTGKKARIQEKRVNHLQFQTFYER
jgi:large subunit ribosomal protein L19